MSRRKRRPPARDVTCPTCFARIGESCTEHDRPREPHPDRVQRAKTLAAAAKQQHSRKTGSNRARLTYTRAPSAEIRDRERANRAPRPVTVRVDPDVAQWWLTPARHGSVCDECYEPVPAGSALAYRFADHRAVCQLCADRLGLAPKPSKAWRRAQQSAVRGT